MRQMILIAFLQAQNCTNHVSSWRHPLSRTDYWSPDYYRHIGRVLQHGKFDLGFFDDRLSMPDIYGRNHDHTVRYGIRCVKMDAVTVPASADRSLPNVSASARATLTPQCRPCHANARCRRAPRCGPLPPEASPSPQGSRQPAIGPRCHAKRSLAR